MLAINAIKNVNSTLKSVNFGHRSNELVMAPNAHRDMVQGGMGGLLTGFVGTVKNSPLFNFNSTVQQRSQKINQGLEQAKVNYFA